ncbi:MAG: small ribosomal subunit Rsm22 family protein [Phycisphaerales bacterium]
MRTIVEPSEFRNRLESLEAWLWRDGATSLRLPPPAVDVLAQRVVDLSDVYTTERDMLGRLPLRQGHLLAKVLYFLCADAPKPHLVLGEVDARLPGSPVPRHVIDFGCGVGATSAGFLLSLASGGDGARPSTESTESTESIESTEAGRAIRITGVDRDPAALEVWRAVVERCAAITGVRVDAQPVVGDAATVEMPDGVDLVLCQAALNEMLVPRGGGELSHDERTRALVYSWATRSRTVLIEPALRIVTRPLHALRDAVLASGGVRVLAPCPHQRACPMLASPRDWCHEIRPWRPTPRVAEVDRVTKRRDERVKHSFVVLAPAGPGQTATNEAGAPSSPTRLSVRVVSDALVSKGKVERFVCGGDGVLRRLRVLDRERTPDNALLATAERGAMVTIEGLGESDRVAAGVRMQRTL